MKLDRHFFGSELPKYELAPPASPDVLVRCAVYEGDESNKDLVVLVPPWHNGSPQYEAFAKRISANGKMVCAFYLAGEILSADVDKTVNNQLAASQKIIETVTAIQQAKEVQKTHVVSASLGVTTATLAIANGLSIDRLTMVAFGDDLALSLFQGARTQHLRAAIEAKGMGVADLQEAWQKLAPLAHTKILNGKPVVGFLSRADIVIPYERGVALLKALEESKARVRSHVNYFLGHYLTIGAYYKFGQP